jgi:hypothetical protein
MGDASPASAYGQQLLQILIVPAGHFIREVEAASSRPCDGKVAATMGFLLRELSRPYAERNTDGPWQRKSAKVLLLNFGLRADSANGSVR